MALINFTRQMNHLSSSFKFYSKDSQIFFCVLLVTEPRKTLFVNLVLVTFILSLICTSQWSYLLASLLVMGGAVWSYFQTFSIRQSTYVPVVMIGSGLSIMYVMALVFITELIGENKVSVSKQVLMVSKKDLVANSDQFSYSAFPTSHF